MNHKSKYGRKLVIFAKLVQVITFVELSLQTHSQAILTDVQSHIQSGIEVTEKGQSAEVIQ